MPDSSSDSSREPRLANGPVLFVCVENAGRSQMAEAFAKKHGMNAQSAGTIPSTRVNPTVVDVMRERGIDISLNHPKTLTPELIRDASLVVTMGCSIEEACPKPIIAQMQKKLVEGISTTRKASPWKELEKSGTRSNGRSWSYPRTSEQLELAALEV